MSETPDQTEASDQEPKEGSASGAAEKPRSRRAFSRLRRELTEEELAEPAIHRLILDELDQQEEQIAELSDFRDQFYKTDREKAVLEEKLKGKSGTQLLQDAAIAIGAVFIGLAPSIWDKQPYGYMTVAAGAVLIIGGFRSKRT